MLKQKRLKELLHYDPDTGTITWISSTGSVKSGDVAGSINSRGYILIRINGKSYPAHRLAFLYMEGSLPIDGMDHINHDKVDNRWVNLREASQAENTRNASVRNDNKSGIAGVSWKSQYQKWRAQININRKQKHLGYFDNLEFAGLVMAEAREKFGYHANHGANTLHQDKG